MNRYSIVQLKLYVMDNVLDVGDLVHMLELDVQDILEAFPHKLLEHTDKFGIVGSLPEDIEDDDPYGFEEDEVQEDED